MPPPVVDYEMDQQAWYSTSGSAPEAVLSRPNRMTEVFSQTCKLVLRVEPIIGSHAPRVMDRSQLVCVSLEVQAWFDELPPELLVSDASPHAPFPHIIMMNVCY
ncbi:Fungal specific transcription factor domain [Ceratobasidium sp. AG-Ba]|nr:Fungal specific transcription factor domain [Ceratobasidium sp. AG-Ba]QRW07481.1 Fungal specific transcription factor domain [Ceratobasidium sp. AG-Ba]